MFDVDIWSDGVWVWVDTYHDYLDAEVCKENLEVDGEIVRITDNSGDGDVDLEDDYGR